MDIALKYKIAEKIIQSEDDVLLNEIEALLRLSENDFWGELPVEVKAAINQAKDNWTGAKAYRTMKLCMRSKAVS